MIFIARSRLECAVHHDSALASPMECVYISKLIFLPDVYRNLVVGEKYLFLITVIKPHRLTEAESSTLE